MKKLAILGFALITAFLAACSDDSSSSSSKEAVVSCTFKSTLDGKKISSACWQMPDAYKDSLEKLCEGISVLSKKEGPVENDECESSNVRKECVDSDNSESIIYIYDEIMARISCASTFNMASNIGKNEEGEETEEDEDYIPHIIYNVPEQRCVQFNALYRPKSDLSNLYGEVHVDLGLTQRTGIYEFYDGRKCDDVVVKTPVVTCSDGDEINSVTVFFYDKNLAGKKCKNLVTFIPAAEEEAKSEEENAEAEEE